MAEITFFEFTRPDRAVPQDLRHLAATGLAPDGVVYVSGAAHPAGEAGAFLCAGYEGAVRRAGCARSVRRGEIGMTYPVILADPPWRYRTWKGDRGSRTAESFYNTMSTDALAALPVGDLAAADCALFLWATAPCLPDALRVLGAWGFAYKTIAFSWIKTARAGAPAFGLGHYTRSNVELVLLGIRGRMTPRDRGVSSVVLAPRGKHSEKPEEVRRRIERLYAGPYLELFARRPAAGWDTWGNEIDSTPAVARILTTDPADNAHTGIGSLQRA